MKESKIKSVLLATLFVLSTTTASQAITLKLIEVKVSAAQCKAALQKVTMVGQTGLIFHNGKLISLFVRGGNLVCEAYSVK